MASRTAWNPVTGEVITEANLEKLPGGWIGYNESTAWQTGIGTSPTDLTGLSVSVTVGPTRRIRISYHVSARQQTGPGTTAELRVYEGATLLSKNLYGAPGAAEFMSFDGSVVLTPTSGSHTYKLSLQTGGNTIDTQSAADDPSFILVEDIGPAS